MLLSYENIATWQNMITFINVNGESIHLGNLIASETYPYYWNAHRSIPKDMLWLGG